MKDIISLKQSIERNWLTWLSLHHFLPNKHLLTLLEIVIEKVFIEPKVKLNDLFEIESISSDSCVISKLFTRAIHSENQQIVYIQSLFQNIFSKDDNYFESIKSIKFDNFGKSEELDSSIKTVLAALILGCQEILGASKNAQNICNLPELQTYESFILLCKSLIQVEKTSNKKDIKDDIFSDFKFFDIIEVLIIKHLGDLLFEADKIELALKMYEASKTFINNIKYQNDYELWFNIIEHSIFSCQRILKGAEFSVKNLYDKSSKVDFNKNLPFLINSKVDMNIDNQYLSFNLIEKFEFKNNHIYSVEENFLANLNFYNMNYFNAKVYNDTLRKIRGKLRRQIAIGSSYYVRALKSTYGKAIIYQFIDYTFNKEVFLNGIKQIIDSEFTDTLKQISQETQWKPFNIEKT